VNTEQPDRTRKRHEYRATRQEEKETEIQRNQTGRERYVNTERPDRKRKRREYRATRQEEKDT
jgi:hypothetical protein